jgi:hypothetical protein
VCREGTRDDDPLATFLIVGWEVKTFGTVFTSATESLASLGRRDCPGRAAVTRPLNEPIRLPSPPSADTCWQWPSEHSDGQLLGQERAGGEIDMHHVAAIVAGGIVLTVDLEADRA